MEYNWSQISPEKRQRWLQLCPPDTYRIVAPVEISGLLSDSLINKYDSVVLINSGLKDADGAIFMANGLRVDAKETAIDQMPFGFGYLGGGTTSGLLIQHGSWENRTSSPPPEFWTHVQQSGIGTCYPLSVLPNQNHGLLSELRIETQTTGAFGTLIAGLKSQFPDLPI